jgi:hypothetical protein
MEKKFMPQMSNSNESDDSFTAVPVIKKTNLDEVIEGNTESFQTKSAFIEEDQTSAQYRTP